MLIHGVWAEDDLKDFEKLGLLAQALAHRSLVNHWLNSPLI